MAKTPQRGSQGRVVTFARDELGLELWPGQARVLDEWEASGRRTAVLCLGRRSGKGLMAAVAALFNVLVEDYAGYLRPGEQRFVVVVATRQEQAAEFVRVVRELIANARNPHLRTAVVSDTDSELVFSNGVTLRAMPCSSRSTRGLAISMLILDEGAHMQTSDDGFAAGKQVWRALLPSLAQFREKGRALVTSTPMWRSGIFHELYSAKSDDIWTVQAPTWDMNPNIRREDLDQEFLADPEYAQREYGAEFVDGMGAFLDSSAVMACVVRGRAVVPPEDFTYAAAIDPAFQRDAFALSIVHRESDGSVVQDVAQSWRGKDSPLSSDAVLDEIADTLKRYRCYRVTSDQFAVVPITDALRSRGIEVDYQPLTADRKADIFATLKRAINLGYIELLDKPALISELINLEARPTPSGKPRIAAAGSGKDDQAMALATAVHALEQPDRGLLVFLVDDEEEPGADEARNRELVAGFFPT